MYLHLRGALYELWICISNCKFLAYYRYFADYKVHIRIDSIFLCIFLICHSCHLKYKFTKHYQKKKKQII